MKKILIIHTAFIGDIVLSTPLIRAIHIKYPNAKIDYVTNGLGAQILKNNPLLNKVIIYDKKGKDKGLKGFFKIKKELSEENYDIAYLPHRYLRTTLLAFFSGIKERVGYSNATLSFLLTEKIDRLEEKHEVERLTDLVHYSGRKLNIEIYPSEENKKVIDNVYIKNNVEKQTKKIVLSPGSNWETKMYPYYKELLEKLSEDKNNTIFISGTKQEKEIELGNINKSNIIDLRGKLSLLEFAALIKRSDMIICNDSSPLHIASAFEKPYVVTFFGPTAKSLGFYPWGDKNIIIENNTLDCRPCGKHGHRTCPKKHFKCMLELKPDKAYAIIDNILKGI